MAFKRGQLSEVAKTMTRTIEVPMGEGNVLTLTIRPLAYDEDEAQKILSGAEGRDEDEQREILASFLSEIIDSWDMTEEVDGEDVETEPDTEYLLTFTNRELMTIMMGMENAQGGFTEGASGSSSKQRTSVKKSPRNLRK